MNAKLRPIKPMNFPDLKPAKVEGVRPSLKWVAPTSLLVDGTYQRDLSERSIRLIRRMIEDFAWCRLKPPIVVQAGSDSFHIIDGQHTAIVAATLKVPQIPIFIVEAESLDERARAFVGHNSDRIIVSPFDIYRALLASGDPMAKEVDQVCKKAGVRIRNISPSSAIAEGDSASVGRIQNLVKRRGVKIAQDVLTCLVKAKRAPITATEILAVDHVICSEFKGAIDLVALAAAIRVEGTDGINKAHAKSRINRTPLWRELAARYSTRIGEKNAA